MFTFINFKLTPKVGIILLSLLTLLACNDRDNENDNVYYNKYNTQMPMAYSKVLSKTNISPSELFSTVNSEFGKRELLIFKLLPTVNDLHFKFDVTITLKDSGKILNIKTENSSLLLNYNGKTFGVYRQVLPFIDIDKIVVSKITNNKWDKKYTQTIEYPFKALDKNPIETKSGQDGQLLGLNPYKVLFINQLEKRGIQHLPFEYTIKSKKLVQTTPELNAYKKEKDLTIAKLKGENIFWEFLNAKELELSKVFNFDGSDAVIVNELLAEYQSKEKSIEEVLNLNKTATYFALKELFSGKCNDDIFFVFNKELRRIEPFFVNSSNCLGNLAKYTIRSRVNNLAYLEAYSNAINDVVNLDVELDIVEPFKGLENHLQLINQYKPELIFDIDVLKINQRLLQQKLTNEGLLKFELIDVDKFQIKFTAENFGEYPVLIKGLSHKKRKDITNVTPQVFVQSKGKKTITMNLPRSFENLFVSKKTKEIGFKLEKHIYELFVTYSIYGLDVIKYSEIRPYETIETVDNDLFRAENDIFNLDFISVDEVSKTISFSQNKFSLDHPLLIPKGYEFVLGPGVEVDIINGGKIISYSPLKFKGTKEHPIVFDSSDLKGQGFLVLCEGQESELEHVVFNHLRNLVHGPWDVSGAVSFYESPVQLDNVHVMNNACEDALNIIRTHFTMKNSKIIGTQSDAFDGDFVEGLIIDCTFDKIGNDAIDVSGSNLTIKNVKITNAGDKGLSAGEDSIMNVDSVEIDNSEIAIAGKDLSIVTANNLIVKNTKLAFTAFKKKSEFGPSNITVTGIQMNNVELDHLIETESSLSIDGKQVETVKGVKNRMYGVEFGVSSAETRNVQQ